LALRRLVAALTLALTGLTVFILHTRDKTEPRLRQLTSASVAAPSTADVHYAHMMITHHEQAVRMSRALTVKAGVPERIRLIADFIAHDQQREINETNAWLGAWKEQPRGAPGPGHGMLTEAQLDDLDRAGTREAAALFLRLMIEHHQGAITMSRSLLDGTGRNAYIHSLAKHVINEQSAEIDAMRKLLRP
jgi:uncharacterized protein (DUF305 family)